MSFETDEENLTEGLFEEQGNPESWSQPLIDFLEQTKVEIEKEA